MAGCARAMPATLIARIPVARGSNEGHDHFGRGQHLSARHRRTQAAVSRCWSMRRLLNPAVIRFDKWPGIPKGVVIPSRLGYADGVRNQQPYGSWGER